MLIILVIFLSLVFLAALLIKFVILPFLFPVKKEQEKVLPRTPLEDQEADMSMRRMDSAPLPTTKPAPKPRASRTRRVP